MNHPVSALGPLTAGLSELGVNLGAWAVAWARTLPSVLLVPAFGLRALTVPVRVALGLVLALSVIPAVRPEVVVSGWWPGLVLEQVVLGLPVALTAATALWAATMAGGLVDELRATPDTVHLPTVERGATPTATLLSMLSAIVFLQTGGPARVVSALARADQGLTDPLLRAAETLTAGIELAVAVAAPVVVAAIVVEVALALTMRASPVVSAASVAAPARSLVLLAVAALLLDRMVALLAVVASGSP